MAHDQVANVYELEEESAKTDADESLSANGELSYLLDKSYIKVCQHVAYYDKLNQQRASDDVTSWESLIKIRNYLYTVSNFSMDAD